MALVNNPAWPQLVQVPESTWDLGGYAEAPSEWGLPNLVEDWRRIAEGFADAATFLEGLGSSLSDWIGESGGSFDQHRRELIKDLDDCSAAASAAQGVIEEIHGLYERSSAGMYDIIHRLAGQLETTGARSEGTWAFVLQDEEQERLLADGLGQAAQLRREHAAGVRSLAGRLDPTVWEGVAARWALAVSPPPYIPDPYRSNYYPFDAPPTSPGTHAYLADPRDMAWVVSTDTFASDIQVVPSEQTSEDGRNPVSYTFTFDDKEVVVPWGGRMSIQSNGQMYHVYLNGNSPEFHRQVWGDDVPFEPPAINPDSER